jgi:hypothetical protein
MQSVDDADAPRGAVSQGPARGPELDAIHSFVIDVTDAVRCKRPVGGRSLALLGQKAVTVAAQPELPAAAAATPLQPHGVVRNKTVPPPPLRAQPYVPLDIPPPMDASPPFNRTYYRTEGTTSNIDRDRSAASSVRSYNQWDCQCCHHRSFRH